jgi:hypothetical protein
MRKKKVFTQSSQRDAEAQRWRGRCGDAGCFMVQEGQGFDRLSPNGFEVKVLLKRIARGYGAKRASLLLPLNRGYFPKGLQSLCASASLCDLCVEKLPYDRDAAHGSA